MKITRSNPL
jgi:hypothetical protein